MFAHGTLLYMSPFLASPSPANWGLLSQVCEGAALFTHSVVKSIFKEGLLS